MPLIKRDAGCPLEVRDLHYAYPGGENNSQGRTSVGRVAVEALRGVSFSLRAGEKTALVGANGSGKSTLLLHLAGALTANKTADLSANETAGLPANETADLSANETADLSARRGTVLLWGEPAEARRLREAVGLVFQDPDDQLFMPRVLEDVAFGLVARGMAVEEAQARAMTMLKSLGAAHLAERPPYRLSGGEKRIVSLGGILVMEPEILILDEPTAGLDPRARRRVIETLRGMNRTLLLATHDLDMALEVCGRAVVLSGGRVAEDGPLPQLFRDSAMLRESGLEPPLSWTGQADGCCPPEA